jgi:hypothetical protein
MDEAYDRLWLSSNPNFFVHHDKFEAAVALQPFTEVQSPPVEPSPVLSIDRVIDLADLRRAVVERQIDLHNTSPVSGDLSPHELVYGPKPLLHPRPSWMLHSDNRTDEEEADAAWHTTNNLLLPPILEPSSHSVSVSRSTHQL